jgi:hypothetical protein
MRRYFITYKDRFYLTFRNPDTFQTLLKAIVDIYTQNKIWIKFNNKLSKPVEINKGVCQGCPLPPTLINIYLDEIIKKKKKQDITGIKLSKKPSNCQCCYLQTNKS